MKQKRQKRRRSRRTSILTCFGLLCLMLSFSVHTAGAQTKISLDFRDTPIKNVLEVIEQRSGYRMMYSQSLIDVDKTVSLSVRDKEVPQILDMLFKGTNIIYAIKQNQIVLSQGETVAERPVTGQVLDSEGEPIVGVTVVVKGNDSKGAVTDAEGKFRMNLSPGDELSFTFIGYIQHTLTVGSRGNIVVTMETESKELEEVVVIGYGEVRRSDLTGAISTLEGSLVADRLSSQTSIALQGSIPGVTVSRSSGAPGASADIRIRGITTIGDNSPLVIVDGVPARNIDDVVPGDIETITVLKDAASASIYGARAASGVIVITTKRAKGEKFSLDYSFDFGIHKPTRTPSYTGAVRYMEFANEIRWNDAGNDDNSFPVYPEDEISNYYLLNAENPNKYPITDWPSLILKSAATSQQHTIGITAGTNKTLTKATFSYEDNNALYKNRTYDRYAFRINNDININKYIKVSIDGYFKQSLYVNPITDPLSEMYKMPQIYAATWSDGRIAEGKQGTNPYAALLYGGVSNKNYTQVEGRGRLDVMPVKGLTLSAVYAPRFTFEKFKSFRKQIDYYSADDPTLLTGTIHSHASTNLSETRNDHRNSTVQFYANYEGQFGDHRINAMVGYEGFHYFYEGLGASRQNYLLSDYPYLNVGPEDLRDNSGDAYENAYNSYFARVIYSYKNKYMIQGNFRRDGSSRFHKDHRWGNFPSVSVGWVLSEESFFKNSVSRKAVSHIKFRASYGQLGNERIDSYYPYQAMMDLGYTSLFYQNGVVISKNTAQQIMYAVEDITWETTTTYDIGVDMSFLNDRLTFTADWYRKNTKDMLLNIEIPSFLGFSSPDQNVGKMTTKGFELQLGWRSHVGDFRYSVSAHLSDYRSKMGYMGDKISYSGDFVTKEGSYYREWWGYLSDGIFQTQEEIDSSPTMNNSTKPGDVKYVDVSGPDGVPDGKISSEYDKVLLGNSRMEYLYGGSVSLGYKGVELGLQFQGVGRQTVRLETGMVQPLQTLYGNVPTIIDGKYWSHHNSEEVNKGARYPRLTNTNSDSNYSISDFWLFNGSYFRVKNITLSYTLPERFVNKAMLKNVKVYASVTDLPAISKYPDGWDPESVVAGYPITTSYHFGVSLNF